MLAAGEVDPAGTTGTAVTLVVMTASLAPWSVVTAAKLTLLPFFGVVMKFLLEAPACVTCTCSWQAQHQLHA